MEKLYHLFLLAILVVIIPTLVHANVKEKNSYLDNIFPFINDTYWRKKTVDAEKENNIAYTPDPYAVSRNMTSLLTR
ncbi:unnamed protein product [Lathyrus sativus]|nr:unnamed protein product [Lathyrus sativus]